MSKVTGPLLSLDARGKIGGAIVFGGWKGIQTVRQLVTPSNPRTTGQMEVRSKLAVAGKATKVLASTSTLADHLRSVAPNGQSYASYLQKELLGANFATIDAAMTAYNLGGNATVKGYFDTEAGVLGVQAVDLSSIGGDTYTAGSVLAAMYFGSKAVGGPSTTPAFSALSEANVQAFGATTEAV